MHAVAGSIMRLPLMLEFAFYMTQFCVLLFKISLRFFYVARKLFLLGFGFVLAQQP